MIESALRELLEKLATGDADVEEAVAALRSLPFEDLSFAKVDHHRAIRQGFPEVIYCEGKTPEQVAAIVHRLAERCPRVLGTRASKEHFAAAAAAVGGLEYHEMSRTLFLDREPEKPRMPGVIVVAAGTSDLPVAEEAVVTLRMMGHEPRRIYDVGVAGLQRTLQHVPELQAANVVIVCAGMEGALPSVVGGLTGAPVIAVPTSVGYGASFGGLAALLGMLNSCAAGVAVMNIDNGFGAAHMAARINARIHASLAAGRSNEQGNGQGNGQAAKVNGTLRTSADLRA